VPTVAPEIAAAPAVATLVTADATTSDAQSDERRGRRRRRRRGRGGRGTEGEAVAGPVEADEQVDVEAAVPAPSPASPQEELALPEIDVRPPEHEVAVVTPGLIVVPATYVPPVAAAAPMPIEQLQAMLQLAGLSLVQTEPARLEETRARLAAEPRPVHVPRERPVLPPLDQGPLVQVETRQRHNPTA